MKFNLNLNEFNRRFAEELLPTFPTGIKAVQQIDDTTLLFRGPIPLADDHDHIGTHVVVSLDKEVRVALDEASPADREAMTEILISNLRSQVQARYNSTAIGRPVLKFVGTMRILRPNK